MSKLVPMLYHFLRDEEGQDVIEYGLLAAFIAIVAAAILFLFRDPLEAIYQRILDYLNAAETNLPPAPGGG
jgi:Flp pilus assembly pilin Flp